MCDAKGESSELDTQHKGLQRWEDFTKARRNTTFLVKEFNIQQQKNLLV